MIKGRFTLPGEAGMEKEIAELAHKWGADAIRDSDGTTLSQELIDMGLQVYSTICLVRMDNEFAKANKQYLQQIYLTSEYCVATEDTLSIDIMEDTFKEQFEPNTDVDIKKYWQVMDRTTGKPIDSADWDYKDEIVTIHHPVLWHKYSVNFLAYQIWEPISMYNHLTNDWDEEHKMPIDPIYPEVQEHILKVFEKWLQDHPKTEIVRLTTFFYCFDLVYNRLGKEKMVNWFGYLACVSPRALDMFEAEYGYRMYPEDFIDNRQYNTPFKNPQKKYLDWMDFMMGFVSGFAKKCVDLVHKYNKKAIMFLGDHWAGTEPYGPYFQDIGLDAVVGAAGDGVTTRMIGDIPVAATEARFYPYLFPDTFHEGGDPVGASTPIWIQCRRAIVRQPMDRMGYGGYISLALKFPDFIEHVTDIAHQFKAIAENAMGKKAYSAPFKVAVLNSWGHLRAWQTHQVAHSLWNQRCYSYIGAIEALSGMRFDVEFINFEDIKEKGIDSEIKVILNAGDAGTTWSGGDNWGDEKVVTTIRQWVYNGGAFIGIGEPTAYEREGELFVLSDVLGVQKEIGFTASNNKPIVEVEKTHFITEGLEDSIDYGEGMSMIYRASANAKVLDYQNLSCCIVANEYGKGRSVYFAGMPYNAQNTRLLERAIFWAANAEDEMFKCFSENIYVEANLFPNENKVCVLNNSDKPQKSVIRLGETTLEVDLKPLESRWIEL
jgi:1,3-beta-galactosyl-N-acetylhexosamine phosphorylase